MTNLVEFHASYNNLTEIQVAITFKQCHVIVITFKMFVIVSRGTIGFWFYLIKLK